MRAGERKETDATNTNQRGKLTSISLKETETHEEGRGGGKKEAFYYPSRLQYSLWMVLRREGGATQTSRRH